MKKVTAIKGKARTAFKKWVRLRDCLITTGTKEWCVCITCGRRFPFKLIQGGHFQAGSGNAIYFEETNCHGQCYQCNVPNHGEQYKYGLAMIKMYGQKEVDRLVLLHGTTKDLTYEDYEEIKKLYDEKFRELNENN